MLVYCIVRYTALDVWRCDLCYMFHALTICLGGRRETTSLTIIDRREQCFIYISGCKIRTLPMRIEMCLGCIQKSSHLVRDSPGRPRPKASVCFSVLYTY